MIAKIKKREDINNKYKWDLSNLVTDDNTWQQKYDELMLTFNDFNKYRNTLSTSPEILLECLNKIDTISEEAGKVYIYAQMKHHEDTTNNFYQGMADKSDTLLINLSTALSFLNPEIISIGIDNINLFMDTCKGLQMYKHFFNDLLRSAPHVLSSEKEEILAMASEIGQAPENIYSMINNADIKFGNVTDANGEEIELTQGRYTSLLESTNSLVRKNTFNTYYDSYINQKNTLATTYNSSVKKDIFFSKVRNYNSSLEASLFSYNIPKEIYTNLINTVNEHLPLMHRYVELRKKCLGLEELHMYDLYVPIVENADTNITYDEACETLLKGLKPLGDDYISILKESFNNGWIDVYENEGKRNGAYSWGAYGAHPYVLLNFDNKISDMFTLAHEMGHALHSHYTWATQPYIYGDYTIFLAEIASTVNEALLMDYLLKNTTDKTKNKYLLNYFMEQFRGTLFRQTMFAEFEMITHEMAERNEPLTVESLNKLYRELNIKYYGTSIIVDDKINYEWARIPHFYNAFYVYQYATGYSAAIAFSKKILEEGATAVENYKDFLKSGSSDYSIEILKKAGIDMTSKKPIKDALSVFEDILNKFESVNFN